MKNKMEIPLGQMGKRLKAVRESLAMTLLNMEEITGLSKSQVAAAEKGEKKPSSIYLFGLIRHFNVNINYIFTGKGEMFLDGKNQTPEEKDIKELFDMMKKVKMLKYTVLGFYHEYKKRNEDILKEFFDDI